MLPVRFGRHDVYLYESMFYTRSPLLKELYCESHRFEPWAVNGDPQATGRYVFRNVLYVDAGDRSRLLADILRRLESEPSYQSQVEARFREASRRLCRHLVRTRRGDHGRENVAALMDAAVRVLSAGIFKEALEPNPAMQFLAAFMPVEPVRANLLDLYQPLCLPHFLKFELKLLYFARRHREDGGEAWVSRCIEQCAYLSKFFLEPTPLDDPEAMKAKMDESDPGKRGELLRNHQRVVERSLLAERDILQHLAETGTYTLRSKRVVMGCLRFIQFISTYEELKHIQAVQAARALRRVMEAHRLDLDTTLRADLLKRLR
ncbi:MAG TPA: hypothetical protein VFA20_34695 [Myxococcaceae bacterium]|nr:hypothetical protein [Myxococcaceae bacterium]